MAETYGELTGNKGAVITIVVSGPMRSGKSHIKKIIEGALYANKEELMYNPKISVIEGDILDNDYAILKYDIKK